MCRSFGKTKPVNNKNNAQKIKFHKAGIKVLKYFFWWLLIGPIVKGAQHWRAGGNRPLDKVKQALIMKNTPLLWQNFDSC